jgi:hypothetical protein
MAKLARGGDLGWPSTRLFPWTSSGARGL